MSVTPVLPHSTGALAMLHRPAIALGIVVSAAFGLAVTAGLPIFLAILSF
jgi:hypothetical protein